MDENGTTERRLAGRVALVTGGSRGIGAATSLRLAAEGAHVVLTYRADSAAAHAVVARIESGGGSAEAALFDVADPAGAAAVVERIAATGNGVDILVSNANAGFRRAALTALSADEVAGPVAANLRVAHLLTVAVAPGMRARGFGRLVYVSSGMAHGPAAPGMAVNGTGKAALNGYVRFVVDELTSAGVTANIVAPGMVDTDASRGAGLPVGLRAALEAATPVGRIAEPADVAGAIALLVLAGDMVNGVELPVTGGLSRSMPPSPVAQRAGAAS